MTLAADQFRLDDVASGEGGDVSREGKFRLQDENGVNKAHTAVCSKIERPTDVLGATVLTVPLHLSHYVTLSIIISDSRPTRRVIPGMVRVSLPEKPVNSQTLKLPAWIEGTEQLPTVDLTRKKAILWLQLVENTL